MRQPVADNPGQGRLHDGNTPTHEERRPVQECCIGCRAPQGGCDGGQEQPGHKRVHGSEPGDEQRPRHGCSRKEEGGQGREETNSRLGKVEVLVDQGNDRRDGENGDSQPGSRQPQQDESRQEFLGCAGVFRLTHTLTTDKKMGLAWSS